MDLDHLNYDPITGIFTKISTGKKLGAYNSDGYLYVFLKGKMHRAHRIAWFYMTGKWPKNEIDHINGIRDDNRWCNLREVNHQENHKNRRQPSNNTTGHTGICWNKALNKWKAHIQINNKQIHLGYFKNKMKAIIARKKAEIKYNFHPNHGKLIK